jgi:hypothetical protein
MMDIAYIPLANPLKHEIADLYARVFAGPPWYEIKRCANCNETYGKEDDLIRFSDGFPCRRCQQPLQLLDYWYGGPALEVFEDAVARSGFVGIGARDVSGQLIGFSWGFAVPEADTPTVLFGQAAELLRSSGLELATTFYAAETGVDPAYRMHGIGSQVSYTRLRKTRDVGFHNVCFRTINPKLVSL